jgi:hypothetical protein
LSLQKPQTFFFGFRMILAIVVLSSYY